MNITVQACLQSTFCQLAAMLSLNLLVAQKGNPKQGNVVIDQTVCCDNEQLAKMIDLKSLIQSANLSYGDRMSFYKLPFGKKKVCQMPIWLPESPMSSVKLVGYLFALKFFI